MCQTEVYLKPPIDRRFLRRRSRCFVVRRKRCCSVMKWIVLHCTELECPPVFCTVLYSTLLYCTLLYCSALYTREERGVCTHGSQHYANSFIAHYHHLCVVTMWFALRDGHYSYLKTQVVLPLLSLNFPYLSLDEFFFLCNFLIFVSFHIMPLPLFVTQLIFSNPFVQVF